MSSNISDCLNKAPAFVRETASEAETLAFAQALGRLLRPGDWLALMGELGTGKTLFVRGLAQALDCKDPVSSPTYVLIQTYKSKNGRCALNHVDLYRIAPKEIALLEWEDLLCETGVTVLEWAEKASTFWPPTCLPVKLSHAGDDRRSLSFYSAGERSAELIRKVKQIPAPAKAKA